MFAGPIYMPAPKYTVTISRYLQATTNESTYEHG
jgi:hypothetical protein